MDSTMINGLITSAGAQLTQATRSTAGMIIPVVIGLVVVGLIIRQVRKAK